MHAYAFLRRFGTLGAILRPRHASYRTICPNRGELSQNPAFSIPSCLGPLGWKSDTTDFADWSNSAAPTLLNLGRRRHLCGGEVGRSRAANDSNRDHGIRPVGTTTDASWSILVNRTTRELSSTRQIFSSGDLCGKPPLKPTAADLNNGSKL